MSKQFTAYATAKVTVETTANSLGSWGPDCTIAQADRRARESALGQVHRALKDIAGCRVTNAEVEVYLKERT